MLSIRPCGSDLHNRLYRFILFLVLFEVTWQLVASQCAIAAVKVFAVLPEALKVQADASSHLSCSH